MTQFMAQDSNHLFRFTSLEERIIDNNVLLPRQTIEVRIAVSAPLAAIDDVELMQGELELLCELLNTGFDWARLKRGQLIEQRQDRDRVDSDSKDLDEDTEEPEVIEEAVTRLLDDLESRSQDRATDHNSQRLTLQNVRYPKLDGLLVEAEFFLEDERVVIRDRQRKDRRDEVEDEKEDQSMPNFTLKPGWEVSS